VTRELITANVPGGRVRNVETWRGIVLMSHLADCVAVAPVRLRWVVLEAGCCHCK
jgi:hypothetical protein